MPKDTRSFFERLSGSSVIRDTEEPTIDMQDSEEEEVVAQTVAAKSRFGRKESLLSTDDEGQLMVDVYQSPDEIVIQSVVAGLKPDDLDVSITHDMVTIKGRREKHREISEKDYFYQELYWGAFSRSIMLPQEIDVDGAEATFKNGLLTIKLPKIDKEKTQKLKIKQE